jgi:hypothetical protein
VTVSLETIDPRVVTGPVEWADMMYVTLQQFGVPSQLDDPGHWREWATALLSFSGFGTVAIPDPRGFDEWSDWAARFNQSVGGS